MLETMVQKEQRWKLVKEEQKMDGRTTAGKHSLSNPITLLHNS